MKSHEPVGFFEIPEDATSTRCPIEFMRIGACILIKLVDDQATQDSDNNAGARLHRSPALFRSSRVDLRCLTRCVRSARLHRRPQAWGVGCCLLLRCCGLVSGPGDGGAQGDPADRGARRAEHAAAAHPHRSHHAQRSGESIALLAAFGCDLSMPRAFATDSGC